MENKVNTSGNAGALTFVHLGAAGWSISDGKTTVLMDPYLSRVRFQGRRYGPSDATEIENDPRQVIKMSEPPAHDMEVIDSKVPEVDYILVTHSHFNHCMDVPVIAKKTGAKILGTESTINIALSNGVPDEQLIAVKGGEDYHFDELSVRVIPSLHSALSCKLYKDFGTVPQVDRPLSLDEYVEGGTLAYLLRLAGREILLFGSMNYIEREVDGLRPDTVFVASSTPRLEIENYTARLLRCVGYPQLVVATHWDDQGLPFGASQDKAYAASKGFVDEVKQVAPDATVIVPKHFEPFVWAPDGEITLSTAE